MTATETAASAIETSLNDDTDTSATVCCRVRDLIAASLYESCDKAEKSVGGDVFLPDEAKNNFNHILNKISIKSSNTGLTVACLNGKEFQQQGTSINAETAIFPVKELLIALNTDQPASQSRSIKTTNNWLIITACIWISIIIILAIFSQASVISLLLSLLIAAPIAYAFAILTNDISQLYCNKNIFCKIISAIFSQKIIAQNYSKIREEILLKNNSLSSRPLNISYLSFIANVESFGTTCEKSPTTNLFGLVTILISILYEQHGIKQSHITEHIDSLNKNNIINGLSKRSIDDIFIKAREVTLNQFMKADSKLNKLKDSNTTTDKNNLRNEIYRRLGSKQ